MISIRKNDTVKVLTGKDRGKTGRVLMVLPKKDRVLVEGANYVKKHARQTRQDQKGGIIQKEMPLHISNVMLMCKNCNKPTRPETQTALGGNDKTRICRKCKEIIS
ncbi:MAG: 50S ribosomal protein L24 [Candidatus Omnitrophica bacterium]|nr:50S ribosomal protein L24 [Candidatus Omnitrophota bacterium]MBU4487538.1 50S ribosomal protein L24 [Candidatus Omnitrophota bacterium]MCG2705778.1 50S ribosomal protein L24 [Candidatus Omnitrophota bacterium]